MLTTRDLTQDERPTQTESEVLETNFPSKWTGKKKKAGVAIVILEKREFKRRAIKTYPEGHFILHKGRRHKHCKYICTQHRSTQIHKENLRGLQERY